jgi:hypothetical protein
MVDMVRFKWTHTSMIKLHYIQANLTAVKQQDMADMVRFKRTRTSMNKLHHNI